MSRSYKNSDMWVIYLYNTMVEDIIANVRKAFLDEGVDEQVLQDLRHVSYLVIEECI